ncbi:related to Probable ATP-dependent RNA helicase DHR1 [Hanseniaspora guilliermondii]|uniref:RNA helicase n=1 Tax=Hanseniaspora guilliermondii TaxID=56406 RepID=A0A1L0CKL0_9ASCO|nr:related to Probable ATP-dependent RNA helicase DHR1 [Hanseniaspora guilliermondii]
MGTYRKRFNEKARAGQIKKQNELKKIKNKQFTRHIEPDETEKKEDDLEDLDPNRDIIIPSSTEAQKQEVLKRKRKLHDQIFGEHEESKISKQKKKRLEKYIEHQFEREEKKEVIKNLQKFKDLDKDMFISSKKIGLGTKAIDEEMEVAMLKNVTSESEVDSSNDSENDDEFDQKYGDNNNTFIDNRAPSSTSTFGFNFGFGFNNIKVNDAEKSTVSTRKYNWKQNVKNMEKEKKKLDDENDFESSSEEENDQDDALEDSMEEDVADAKQIGKEFKTWATEKIKELDSADAKGPEYYVPNIKVEQVVHEEDLDDGLQETYIPIQEGLKRNIVQINVKRSDEIQKQRQNLPVFKEEHTIMEAIHHNDIVIICGETGSGKTTQLPQFLYENGYGSTENEDFSGMIGITQPRRVAAVSMANRVGNEMGNHKEAVAHQIRFDSTVDSEKTKMKFMTDGVLLREMMQDFKLTKYSAIIIDEAHERNVNTDILIGMLSRCVRFRQKENAKDPRATKKLKLIIMSATLRVADFSENTNLFSVPPPIINVESRQFPVANHFNKKTPYDYQEEAFKKACKIHQKLPKGGILIFMTGQQEILQMCKKLRKEFPFPEELNKKKNNRRGKKNVNIKVDANKEDIEVEDMDLSIKVDYKEDQEKKSKYYEDDLKAEDLDDEVDSDMIDESSDEEEGFDEELDEDQTPNDPLYVLPLYSLLPTKEQLKVFEEPPKGSRICIVATNVAETSITIPNIKYVIDCGRSKERKYDQEKNVQSFEIDWISKASANQRSGRAGRTGPGHCYKLYSSAIYESAFEDFSKPEILRMPIENVVLLMKSMNIHNIMNFPFPTLPEKTSLHKAIKLLGYLGALENDKITEIGRKMSLFPLNPRFSKMLLLSNNIELLPYVVSIVCGLTIGNPFIDLNSITNGLKKAEAEDQDSQSLTKEEEDEIKKKSYKYNKNMSKFTKLDQFSDIFKLLSCISAVDYIPREKLEDFFRDHFLRSKLMLEIIKLRKQIVNIIKTHTGNQTMKELNQDSLKTGKPTEQQIKLLKQIVCAGFVDQVAIRGDYLYPDEVQIGNNTSISKIPYVPVLQGKENLESHAELFAFIHPESILNSCGQAPPKYMIYNTLLKNNDGTRTRIFPLCDIKSLPLVNIANTTSLIAYSKPISNLTVKPKDISMTERLCYVVPHFGDNDNDLRVSFDLNPVYVRQKKVNGDWKVVEFINKK